MPRGGACGGTIPVYDGRRRFDVRLKPEGTQDLAPNKLSGYAGPASACRLTFRNVAGGRTPERTMFWRQVDAAGDAGFPTLVHLAPVSPGGEMMPVRVEVDSPFGWAIVHLKGATGLEPGTKHSENHRPEQGEVGIVKRAIDENIPIDRSRHLLSERLLCRFLDVDV
jgi:hypothetical protein